MSEPDQSVERRVWKFQLGTEGQRDIEMPEAAKPVLFDFQGGQFCVWFECNVASPRVTRRLHVVGTGFVIPRYARHLGSFQEGSYVWHLYEAASV